MSVWSLYTMGLLDLMKVNSLFLLTIAVCFVFFSIKHCLSPRKGSVAAEWPIIGILPSIIANFNRIHDFASDFVQSKNGTAEFKGTGSLGTHIVITSDPANVNHMFNLHSRNYPKGKEFHEIFEILGNGIFNADEESWKMQRKMALSVMMSQKFQSFVVSSTLDKVEKDLLPLLNQMAETGRVFDLHDVFLRFTLDATCILILGSDLGSLAPDFPVIPFAKATEEAEQVLLFRHMVPTFWWKTLSKLNIWQEKKMRKSWDVIDRFLEQAIENTRVNGITTSLLRSYMDQGNSVCDYKFLRDTAITMLSAGKDTTGVALSWFFWLLSKNPNVEVKILQELRDHSYCFSVSGSTSTDQLVYLHASLCETLRLFPPIPFNHKQSLKSDVLPSGQKVLSKTDILVCTYAMGRMEGIWGHDCLEFRPERWLTEEGKLRHEPSYKFFAFNSGSRTCLGKDLSFVQMKAVAAAIIYNFEIQVMEGQTVVPQLSIVLHMRNGLKVKVKKRLNNVN